MLVQCTGNVMDISYGFVLSHATEIPSMYMNILTALACLDLDLEYLL